MIKEWENRYSDGTKFQWKGGIGFEVHCAAVTVVNNDVLYISK